MTDVLEQALNALWCVENEEQVREAIHLVATEIKRIKEKSELLRIDDDNRVRGTLCEKIRKEIWDFQQKALVDIKRQIMEASRNNKQKNMYNMGYTNIRDLVFDLRGSDRYVRMLLDDHSIVESKISGALYTVINDLLSRNPGKFTKVMSEYSKMVIAHIGEDEIRKLFEKRNPRRAVIAPATVLFSFDGSIKFRDIALKETDTFHT